MTLVWTRSPCVQYMPPSDETRTSSSTPAVGSLTDGKSAVFSQAIFVADSQLAGKGVPPLTLQTSSAPVSTKPVPRTSKDIHSAQWLW